MGSNIGSFEAFKKFSSVNTNIYANEANNVNSISLAGTQMFIQGSNYNFSDDLPPPPQAANTNVPASITGKEGLKSRLIGNDPLTKLRTKWEKLVKLPNYVYRGLKGDQDTNFYEYLSLGKIPYFIGGPMLAAVFAFGLTRNNPQARASSAVRTKQIAAGVALYYLGHGLPKKLLIFLLESSGE